MFKAGYKNALRGTAMVKIDLNEQGQIAQSEEVAVATKTFNLNVANADNDLAANEKLTALFIGWVGGTQHNATQKMRVTWEV